MHFFKAMIFIILLKTILHKGTAQNLRCIEGEQNIHSALWDEYVNVSKILYNLFNIV